MNRVLIARLVLGLVLGLAPAARADIGVVVTGEATLQPQLAAQLEGWLKDRGHTVQPSSLEPDAINTLIDCFVIDDLGCARAVVDKRAKSQTILFARVEMTANQTDGSRDISISGYWIAKGHEALQERRACKHCTDKMMRTTADDLMLALAAEPPIAAPHPPATNAAQATSGEPHVDEPGSSKLLPITVTAVGGVALVGGIVMIAAGGPPSGMSPHEYRNYRTPGYIVGASGAVAAAVGLYLLLRPDAQSAPVATMTYDGAIVGWSGDSSHGGQMTTKTLTLGIVLIAGCLEANPNYHPDAGGGGSDAGSDAGSGSGACWANAWCGGTAPVCDTMTHVCGACSSDADCSTNGNGPTCLPTGACGGDADVAYVTATGSDAGMCSSAAPCATVSYAVNITSKPYVVLTGAAGDDNVAISRSVDVLGRNSASISGDAAAVVSVAGTGNVGLYDIEVFTKLGGVTGITSSTTGTLTLQRDKVDDCAGIGIVATAGKITAARTEIFGNAGGGISLTTTAFDLENCIVHDNGTAAGGNASAFGGIHIVNSPSATDLITFSTIASNHAKSGAAGGILCEVQSNQLTFPSNIVANNDVDVSSETDGADCTYTYSDFYPASAMIAGLGNGSGNPAFVSTSDYHIGSASAAIDAAAPDATLNIDFYGHMRPDGLHSDMGADEFQH